MRFGGRGITWRIAAPTLALSLVLLTTVVVAAVALRRVQLEADQAMDQALSASEAAEHLEHVFHECRDHLRDYAATGRPAEVVQARASWKESGDHLVEIDAMGISVRGHTLVVEMQRYWVPLQRAIEEIPTSLSPQDRQAVVDRVIRTILDPQILPRATEEHALCVGALHAAREQVGQATRRAGWALLVLGLGGAVGGTVAGFGIARALRRELVELSVPIKTAMGSLNEVVGPVQVLSTDNFAGLDAALDTLAGRVAQVIERLQMAERDRLRNDQMAALGQLAAGLAHELRNPLTAMKTIVDAARRQPGNISLDGRDLAVLDEEITRLNRTLQAFLDYARPPAMVKRRVDLGIVAEKTRQLLAGRAEQQSIHVAIEQPDGPIEVEADPEQLHQVLLNLLLNAFDAIGHDGAVTIRIAGGEAEPGFTVITVADSGPGLPQSVRDRLFEPFVSTKESGTGLGLTTCRRIVEDHGGRIEAADGRAGGGGDGGAVFTIRLPKGGPTDADSPDRR